MTHMNSQPLTKVYTFFLTFYIVLYIAFSVSNIFLAFDLYKAPTVSGVESAHFEIVPPAKRVVFFVADGLRADMAFSLFDNSNGEKETLAPFLRSVVKETGRYGISQSRMPTITRPGHVAIFAGYYEDMKSAKSYGRGSFDSFFDNTRHTWAVAVKGIMSIFANSESKNITPISDPNTDLSADSLLSDIWTLEHALKIFKDAESDPELNEKLRQDKIAFFFHFGGMDRCAHINRPFSEKYAIFILDVSTI